MTSHLTTTTQLVHDGKQMLNLRPIETRRNGLLSPIVID